MKVWIVFEHIENEGQDFFEVFDNKKAADQEAAQQEKYKDKYCTDVSYIVEEFEVMS